MKKIAVVAVLIAALSLAAAVVVLSAPGSDAEYQKTLNYNVGDTINNEIIYEGSSYTGEIPGITLRVQPYAGSFVVMASGEFTNDGIYTIQTFSGSTLLSTVTVNVQAASTYTVTFAASPSAGGNISSHTINVAAGTPFSSSGASMTVGSTTVTATANTGYTFMGWSPSSGTINANTPITANFSPTSVTITIRVGTGGTAQIYDVTAGTESAVGQPGETITLRASQADQIQVMATPDGTHTFRGWTIVNDLIISTDNPYTFTANNNQTLNAAFDAYTPPTRYTVTFAVEGSGSVSMSSASVVSGTSFSSAGDTLRLGTRTITATPDTGYAFSEWSPASGVINRDKTITAIFVPDDRIIQQIRVGTGGTAQIYDVTAGTESAVGQPGETISLELSIGDVVQIVATANTGYDFRGWSSVNVPGLILTSDNPYEYTVGSERPTPFIAMFDSLTPTGDITKWSNGNYNGQISILFDYGSRSKTHVMTADLWRGVQGADQETSWIDSGYDLTVSSVYGSDGLTVTATLSGSTTLSGTAAPGTWSKALIVIDTEHSIVTVTPVRDFVSFTNFTLYDSQTRVVLDYSDVLGTTAIYVISHTEHGAGDRPTFTVTGTRVFLNTYGVVLFDPVINIADYFPQYEAVRLNFYSFALFGDSISLNGYTWPVIDGTVTIQYVNGPDYTHYTPDQDPQGAVQSRTFALSNLYVTWDGNRASLTFVDDRFTIDVGPYASGDKVIGFGGMWYFTTMLYEPTTVTEKTLGPWKVLPDVSPSQIILTFMGVLVVAGAVGIIYCRRTGRGTVDMIVIGAAAVLAFICLGMWY